MRHSLTFSLLLLLFTYTTLTAQDGWFHMDGNTARTAYVETDMAPPFKLDRTIETNEFFHDFTYAYGMVYFTYQKEGTNHIAAFDPDQQMMIWSKKIHGSRGSNGCYPVVTEDIVYAGGQRGLGIYALDRMTGDSLWIFKSENQYGRTFSVKGDYLYAHPSARGLVCLDRKTGALQWEFLFSSAQTVPMVDDDYVYTMIRGRDTIYSLTHQGDVAWTYQIDSLIEDFEAFISKDDTVFVKTRRNLIALDRHTGREMWKTRLPNDTSFLTGINALTWTPNTLVNHEWMQDWRGAFSIQGYDKQSGQLKWSHPLKDGSGSPSTAFGQYLVNINGDDMQIRRSSDGEVVQELKDLYLEYQRVIVLDGMILAISRTKVLVFTPDVTHVDNEPVDKLNWSMLGNPVSDQLHLNLDFNIGSDIQYQVIGSSGVISSISGQLSGKGMQTIDVSSLPAGTYFLQLRYANQTEQQAFIVAR